MVCPFVIEPRIRNTAFKIFLFQSLEFETQILALKNKQDTTPS